MKRVGKDEGIKWACVDIVLSVIKWSKVITYWENVEGTKVIVDKEIWGRKLSAFNEETAGVEVTLRTWCKYHKLTDRLG